jgi:hypothetical protein
VLFAVLYVIEGHLLLGLGFLSRLFARHGRGKVGLTPNVNITEREIDI